MTATDTRERCYHEVPEVAPRPVNPFKHFMEEKGGGRGEKRGGSVKGSLLAG
ncbi:hypothetical protein HBA91_18810, partial [Ochrobactrum sp. MR34]|nr:hypothetical protein [Ochrobactrum sp. MR34]